jgi:hypothetical protein
MYKVINGKRYNTETADRIAQDDGHFGRSDFKWCEETLYRKHTGEYFLYGEGGPLSKYAAPAYGGGRESGEKITPLSYTEAQKWAEEHLDGEEYDKIFGAVDESDEKRTVAIRLTSGTAEKLKRLAAKKGTSASDVIEDLINKA